MKHSIIPTTLVVVATMLLTTVSVSCAFGQTDNTKIVHDTIVGEIILSPTDCIEYITALENYISFLEDEIDNISERNDLGDYIGDVIMETDQWQDYYDAIVRFHNTVYGEDE